MLLQRSKKNSLIIDEFHTRRHLHGINFYLHDKFEYDGSFYSLADLLGQRAQDLKYIIIDENNINDIKYNTGNTTTATTTIDHDDDDSYDDTDNNNNNSTINNNNPHYYN